MKNIIEVVKANKKAIIKRGLIVVGSITGMILLGKIFTMKDHSDELLDETVSELDETSNETDDEGDEDGEDSE